MKFLIALIALSCSSLAMAQDYGCTLTVDGKSPASSIIAGATEANVSLGLYTCSGRLEAPYSSAVISIPSFGLQNVASANGAPAIAVYSEQSERNDEPDFHVTCECGLQ